MAEGFVAMLPSLIGSATQLATAFINHGRGGGMQPSFQMPGLKLPGQTSPFGAGMNPDMLKALISQQNNDQGLAGLGGFTEGSGVPLSDTEQQIPQ